MKTVEVIQVLGIILMVSGFILSVNSLLPLSVLGAKPLIVFQRIMVKQSPDYELGTQISFEASVTNFWDLPLYEYQGKKYWVCSARGWWINEVTGEWNYVGLGLIAVWEDSGGLIKTVRNFVSKMNIPNDCMLTIDSENFEESYAVAKFKVDSVSNEWRELPFIQQGLAYLYVRAFIVSETSRSEIFGGNTLQSHYVELYGAGRVWSTVLKSSPPSNSLPAYFVVSVGTWKVKVIIFEGSSVRQEKTVEVSLSDGEKKVLEVEFPDIYGGQPKRYYNVSLKVDSPYGFVKVYKGVIPLINVSYTNPIELCLEENTLLQFEAVPYSSSMKFERWVINGISYTQNIHFVYVNQNYNIEACFTCQSEPPSEPPSEHQNGSTVKVAGSRLILGVIGIALFMVGLILLFMSRRSKVYY